MIKNRVYFVHARIHADGDEVSTHGGATVAWKVNENGDIVIGQPTICSKADRFVRSVGREQALANLNADKILQTVPASQVALEAENVVRSMVGSQRVFSTTVLYGLLAGQIDQEGVASIFSTSWYEFLVRMIISNETKITPDKYTI